MIFYHEKQSNGFTLIEILIALAVVSLSLIAAINSNNIVIKNTGRLEDKTLAHLVTMNKVAELRLEKQWIELGVKRGKSKLAGREWLWLTKAEKTIDPNLRKVEIQVRLEKNDDAIDNIFVFLAKP